MSHNKKILLIGLDGARADCVKIAKTPNIDKIIEKGVYSYNAQTEIHSVSGPAWTSLLTGVHMDKHGVFENEFDSRNLTYPSISKVLTDELGYKCVAYSNWKPIISHIFEKGTLTQKGSGSDKKVTKGLVKAITKDLGDFYFIQMDEIDGAGHKYTYGPESEKYIKTIEERDELIGDLLEATQQKSEYDWFIGVVSDHGGSGYGHGKPTSADLTIIFAFTCSALKYKGDLDKQTASNNSERQEDDDDYNDNDNIDDDEFVTIVDMIPSIYKFLGINIPNNLDGIPRGF